MEEYGGEFVDMMPPPKPLPETELQCPQIRIDPEDSTCKDTQTEINCQGVIVTFPYPPYPQQAEYMNAVVSACEGSKHALLESPTGTGKTLSLLCASLGWLRNKRRKCPQMNYPRILYSSRTHAQLTQAVRELKKTIYRPVTCVLASRDKLCINPAASTCDSVQLNLTCARLVKTNQCKYAEGSKKEFEKLKGKVLDLEELKNYCKDIGWCPFMAAREMIPSADLVFLPYNYILDPVYHSIFRQIQYANSVIIFDEAHNVQSVVEDAWSFDLTVSWLHRCLNETAQVRKIKESIEGGESVYDNLAPVARQVSFEDLSYVEYPIKNIVRYLLRVKDLGKEGLTYEGKMLIDFFIQGTGYDPSVSANASISGNALFTEDQHGGLNLLNLDNYMRALGNCLEILVPHNQGMWLVLWRQTVFLIFNLIADEKKRKFVGSFKLFEHANYTVDDYKLLLWDDDKDKGGAKATKAQREKGELRSLVAFCFNPGFSFTLILSKKPRSFILTSGTLSPLDSFEKSLRIPFEIKLEQKHIIDPDQIHLQIVTKDISKSHFNFNYVNRNNTKQSRNLGLLLKDICETTPGGVLVFFSSYTMLNQCTKSWKDEIMPMIETKGKRIFYEKPDAVANNEVVKKYKAEVARSGGAVFFAVCRGKVGEGMDFAGIEARTAVVVGVPYPSAKCKRVCLKRDYLDQHNEVLDMNGYTWYMHEAMLAVNQSLGRTIRNKKDFGALLLIDHRYSNTCLRQKLSKWMVDSAEVVEDPQSCIRNLESFFLNMRNKFNGKESGGHVIKQTIGRSVDHFWKKRKFSKMLQEENGASSEAETSCSSARKVEASRSSVRKYEHSMTKVDKVGAFADLLLYALGESLFREFTDLFRKYRNGRIQSAHLVAEYAYSCFVEAMSKAGEGKKERVKTALVQTVQLVKKEDRAAYEAKLAELVSKDQSN